MNDDIGKRLKKLAKVLTAVEHPLCIVLAIVFWALAGDSDLYILMTILGFVFLLVMPFITWIGNMLIYGFGRLIENSEKQTSSDGNNFVKDATDELKNNLGRV